jgi:hypothetical protein
LPFSLDPLIADAKRRARRRRLLLALAVAAGDAVAPGVEPVGHGFVIEGWHPIRFRRVSGKLVSMKGASGNYTLTICGRLMFLPRPVGGGGA